MKRYNHWAKILNLFLILIDVNLKMKFLIENFDPRWRIFNKCRSEHVPQNVCLMLLLKKKVVA